MNKLRSRYNMLNGIFVAGAAAVLGTVVFSMVAPMFLSSYESKLTKFTVEYYFIQ